MYTSSLTTSAQNEKENHVKYQERIPSISHTKFLFYNTPSFPCPYQPPPKEKISTPAQNTPTNALATCMTVCSHKTSTQGYSYPFFPAPSPRHHHQQHPSSSSSSPFRQKMTAGRKQTSKTQAWNNGCTCHVGYPDSPFFLSFLRFFLPSPFFRFFFSLGLPRLCITGLLVRVDVPDDVVGQAVHAVAGAFGHLREALRLGLVFEGVAGEVDACRSPALEYAEQRKSGLGMCGRGAYLTGGRRL